MKKLEIQLCCGNSQIVFEMDSPISTKLIELLLSNKFTRSQTHENNGILFAENLDLVASGNIGSNRVVVKCKNKANCKDAISKLEIILQGL